jgi:hypothetical protein
VSSTDGSLPVVLVQPCTSALAYFNDLLRQPQGQAATSDRKTFQGFCELFPDGKRDATKIPPPSDSKQECKRLSEIPLQNLLPEYLDGLAEVAAKVQSAVGSPRTFGAEEPMKLTGELLLLFLEVGAAVWTCHLLWLSRVQTCALGDGWAFCGYRPASGVDLIHAEHMHHTVTINGCTVGAGGCAAKTRRASLKNSCAKHETPSGFALMCSTVGRQLRFCYWKWANLILQL